MITPQWYVNCDGMAKRSVDAVRNGDLKIVPAEHEKTWYAWLENIRDWCVSRQLWWGHRIPAWYDADGNVYVGRSEADVRDKHNLATDYPLTQDEDVLDTWFSSGLWPFSTLGWPDDTPEVKRYYPTSTLVTGWRGWKEKSRARKRMRTRSSRSAYTYSRRNVGPNVSPPMVNS